MILESGMVSAVVALVVSYVTVKFLESNRRRIFPAGMFRETRKSTPVQSKQKPVNRKAKEKEKTRKLEYETSPDHSAVLRKIASDMKSQLKGFRDSISRVQVPVIVPEIPTMALWSDLIRNHLIEEDFEFESSWYRYIELLREHSRLQSNMFIDIEALIKEKLVGYSAVNSDNVNLSPPENSVYYTSELISSIMRNWIDFIRGSNMHFPIENGTDLGMEDAKKQLKIPDARFLTLYNKKIGSGPEIIVEELQGIAKGLMVDFHETGTFVRYKTSLNENESEISSLESKLREILVKLEVTPVFKGLCEFS